MGDKERDMSAFPDYCQYIKLFPSNEHSYLENLLIELAKRQINKSLVKAEALPAIYSPRKI